MTGSRKSGEVIASNSNPAIKMVRSLQRRKIRQQERAFVVEGVRAVRDVIEAGMVPLSVYIRDDLNIDEMQQLPDSVPVRRVLRAVFDTLTDVPHPQGVLAVVSMLEAPALPETSKDHASLVLVVDAVRDPGNLGTLLRSAAGAGADHVVIAPDTVDPYHPRAVRAAMGAHLRVPFSHRTWEELTERLESYEVVALADASGDAVYDCISWLPSAALIIGGEAFGPTAAAKRCARARVAIPLARGVESLNAGVAGSLLLFEAARQRRGKPATAKSL